MPLGISSPRNNLLTHQQKNSLCILATTQRVFYGLSCFGGKLKRISKIPLGKDRFFDSVKYLWLHYQEGTVILSFKLTIPDTTPGRFSSNFFARAWTLDNFRGVANAVGHGPLATTPGKLDMEIHTTALVWQGPMATSHTTSTTFPGVTTPQSLLLLQFFLFAICQK